MVRVISYLFVFCRMAFVCVLNGNEIWFFVWFIMKVNCCFRRPLHCCRCYCGTLPLTSWEEQIIFTLFTLYNFRRPFPAQLTPTTTPLHQRHIFHPPFVVRIRREFFFDILFFDKRRKLTFMMQKLKQEQEQDYALLLWLFAKYSHRDTHPSFR